MIFSFGFVLALLFHYEVDSFIFKLLLPTIFVIGYKFKRWRKMKKSDWFVRSIEKIGCTKVSKLQLAQKSTISMILRECHPSWVYLRFDKLSKTEAHPFSVCNYENDGQKEEITLYIKESAERQNSWTENLMKSLQVGDQVCVFRENELNQHSLFPLEIESYDKVLLVAGGIGITAILPILDLLSKLDKHVDVVFIWCFQDVDLLLEFQSVLETYCCNNEKIQIQLFLTTKPSTMTTSLISTNLRQFVQVGFRPNFQEQIRSSFKSWERLVACTTCGPDSMVKDVFEAFGNAESFFGPGFVAHMKSETFYF